MDKVATCKIIQEDPTCRELFHEALKYHLLVDRRPEMVSVNSRLKPRTCSGKEKVNSISTYNFLLMLLQN